MTVRERKAALLRLFMSSQMSDISDEAFARHLVMAGLGESSGFGTLARVLLEPWPGGFEELAADGVAIELGRGEYAPELVPVSALEVSSARLLRLRAAVTNGQWAEAVRIWEDLPVQERLYPEALMLGGYALWLNGEYLAGARLLELSVGKLFQEGAPDDPAYWTSYTLLTGDPPDYKARIVAAFGWSGLERYGAPWAFDSIEGPSRRLSLGVERGRRVAPVFRPLFDALLRRPVELGLSRLQQISEALFDLELVDDKPASAAEALEICAQIAFARARVDQALSFQLRAAKLRLPDCNPDRIWAAPILGLDDLRRESSICDIRETPERRQPFSAMPHVDGRPFTPPHTDIPSWIASFQDAEIVHGHVQGSVYSYLITQGRGLVLDGLNIHPGYHIGTAFGPFRALSPTGDVLVDLSAQKQCGPVLGSAVLIGGVNNYYHWLMEYLPKIGLWRKYGAPNEADRFVVHENVSDWIEETLLTLGIARGARLEISGRCTFRVSTLHVPSVVGTDFAVEFLRRSFLPRQIIPKRDRVIYVSRLDQPASRTRVASELELIRVLAQAGVEILIPSEMTFSQQVEAFAGASVVVGAHGAALTNIAFCPPGARVIEINNAVNQHYTFFSEIAKAAGLDFRRYVATASNPGDSAENAAAIVDPDAILRSISFGS
jgi:hypothetical protein